MKPAISIEAVKSRVKAALIQEFGHLLPEVQVQQDASDPTLFHFDVTMKPQFGLLPGAIVPAPKVTGDLIVGVDVDPMDAVAVQIADWRLHAETLPFSQQYVMATIHDELQTTAETLKLQEMSNILAHWTCESMKEPPKKVEKKKPSYWGDDQMQWGLPAKFFANPQEIEDIKTSMGGAKLPDVGPIVKKTIPAPEVTSGLIALLGVQHNPEIKPGFRVQGHILKDPLLPKMMTESWGGAKAVFMVDGKKVGVALGVKAMVDPVVEVPLIEFPFCKFELTITDDGLGEVMNAEGQRGLDL